MQPNGRAGWGELRFPRFQLFNPNRECLHDLEPARQYGLIQTSNASGIPDSIRVFLGKSTQSFRFALPSFPQTDGLYFDNVAFGFVDDPEEPQLSRRGITVQPWHWLNDCFPANETPGLPGTAGFDTCAAYLRTGLNLSPETGDPNRFDVERPVPGAEAVAAIDRLRALDESR